MNAPLSGKKDNTCPSSFREIATLVGSEHDQRKAEQSEVTHYAWRRVQCFAAACEITFGTEGPNMARQLATLFLVSTFKNDKHFGIVWPKSSEIITFASYHVDAASALAVVSSFAGTVHSNSLIARTKVLERFDISDLTDLEAIDLWRATRTETRWMLEADKWVTGEIIRDRRVLEFRIKQELTLAQQEQSNGLSEVMSRKRIVTNSRNERSAFNLEGPCEPHTWRRADGSVVDAKMSPSAYALVDFLWQRERRTATLLEVTENVFDDPTLELSHIQVYGSSANSLFRRAKVKWSIATSGRPIAKVSLVNKPPKAKKKT